MIVKKFRLKMIKLSFCSHEIKSQFTNNDLEYTEHQMWSGKKRL